MGGYFYTDPRYQMGTPNQWMGQGALGQAKRFGGQLGQHFQAGITSPMGLLNAGVQLAQTDWDNPESIGGTVGSTAGGAIGQTLGGPIGSVIGSFTGKKLGQKVGGLFGGDDEEEEARKEAEKEARLSAMRHNLNSLADYFHQGNMAKAQMGRISF